MAADASPAPRIAIVIVNYRSDAYVKLCLESLVPERACVDSLEVMVVDGGSGDGSAERLADLVATPAYRDWVSMLPLEFNGGFGWANNQAMLWLLQGEQPPDFIHLLNPDTAIEPGAVAALATLMAQHAKAGAVGSRLLEPDGRVAGAAFRFPTAAQEFGRGLKMTKLSRALGFDPTHLTPNARCRVDWVTGASVMLRSDALRQVGLFDDGFFLYFEEVELMLRMRRAGWEVWHTPDSCVTHIGGVSTGVSGRVLAARARYPAYWYRSRRRFFALAYGAAGARRASLAWLMGNAIGSIRARLNRSVAADAVPGERNGLLAHGITASADDTMPSTTVWNDEIGVLPAWSRWS